jgi:hypothetical protein
MLQRSAYIFVFEAEYAICPYLARSGNLSDLRLIGRSIDGLWLVFIDLYLIGYIWLSYDVR